ncbi:transcriptional regulator GcvA [Aromatoleum petrolei]|uniref:Transcriptional regulator GcvA n=1 Tax=Aromatoleum petrolei TaxID=76116 RepID=A0ABX1MRQ3_9RHOO|nr:transcriptional regulator GcvA [Aromatoleum petrolei]NMF89025.1 transcriptional regulator GcvA [Aromatoleum petrolei]QTQ34385.1 Transcriptional regulator, LysR family [Aromatoleum petrolei]
MDRLPPLNAIRAFEAAARHLSITVAADELHVTPGAVSRQIRSLEETLGIQLLHRGHRQITLTGPGEDYYRAVTKAIDGLREATRRLTKRAKRKQLKIRAYTTFAMRWLIPRLSSFHAANPSIEVLLTASLDPVDFRKEDIDGAIRLGDGKWSGVNAYRLVDNVLIPVCSQSLLAASAKIRKPADLRHQTLLHSIARPDDWRHWLEAAGVEAQVDARGGMTYQSSAMAYAAAVEGQGFAIAQQFLVTDDLASGKLVAPFRQNVDMGDYTYYLLMPADRKESASMATFRTWLLEQFQKSAIGSTT